MSDIRAAGVSVRKDTGLHACWVDDISCVLAAPSITGNVVMSFLTREAPREGEVRDKHTRVFLRCHERAGVKHTHMHVS